MSATAAGYKAFMSVGTTLKQGSEFLGEAGHVRQAQLSAFFATSFQPEQSTHMDCPSTGTGCDTALAVRGALPWQGGVSYCP